MSSFIVNNLVSLTSASCVRFTSEPTSYKKTLSFRSSWFYLSIKAAKQLSLRFQYRLYHTAINHLKRLPSYLAMIKLSLPINVVKQRLQMMLVWLLMKSIELQNLRCDFYRDSIVTLLAKAP